MHRAHKKGFIAGGLIGVIAVLAVVLIGVGGYFIARDSGEEALMGNNVIAEEMDEMMDGDTMMKVPAPGHEDVDEMIVNDGNMMMGDEPMMMEYAGTRLAGSADAPLLVFTQSDYEVALSSGKLIVLYFYANWCPICREEFPKMEAAFDGLSDGMEIIGFRVNYNDNETDKDEVALARQFGVGYQHTKVFVRNGERVLKSPESWSQARYTKEINDYLK